MQLRLRFARRDQLATGLAPVGVRPCWAHKKNAQLNQQLGISGYKSLTMSYFHTGTRTIIGAEAFHGPVRDGKEWYHFAMVIRHNLYLC